MDDQLHIIIAGDRGKVITLPCSRKKLRILGAISITTLVVLTLTSIFSISHLTKQRYTPEEVAKLQESLKKSLLLQQQLDSKIAALKQSKKEQETAFKAEKEDLISNAVSELTERSELIEEIVSSIGISLPEGSSSDEKNSGGLFVEDKDQDQDELIFKADKYLNAIRFLPLGRPVNGAVTSRYGKRKDPLNKRSAFHTGIDLRGKPGEKIRATANGIVKKAFRNGGHGNYVMLDHGNGYTTSFSHMQKYLVRRGDQVKRGQVIGLIGSTGRSTGPHLHYEVAIDGKTLNPYTFMKLAKVKK